MSLNDVISLCQIGQLDIYCRCERTCSCTAACEVMKLKFFKIIDSKRGLEGFWPLCIFEIYCRCPGMSA